METTPTGTRMTLKDFLQSGIDPRQTKVWYEVAYLKEWQRVNWIDGFYDVNTQSPRLSGFLGRSTWASHAGRTVIVEA